MLRVVQREGNHVWMVFQDRMDRPAEISDALTVNQPDVQDAFFPARRKIV